MVWVGSGNGHRSGSGGFSSEWRGMYILFVVSNINCFHLCHDGAAFVCFSKCDLILLSGDRLHYSVDYIFVAIHNDCVCVCVCVLYLFI